MPESLKNASLVLLSLLAGALLLEVGSRFFVTLPSPAPMKLRAAVMDARGFWIFDPGINFTQDNRTDFQGKAVAINANGMRDVPCRFRAFPGDRPRLFIIGDSQTFGFGLSDGESWPNRLQCRLNRLSRSVRIFNLGIPAINADQYLVRLSQIWPDLRPADRIMVVLTWNDLITDMSRVNSRNFRPAKCPPELAQSAGIEFPACILRPKVFLYPTVTWRLELHRATGFYVPSFESVKEFMYTMQFSSAVAFIAVPKLRILWYRLRGEAALFEKLPKNSFDDNMRIVARMRDLAAEHGASTHVALLPNRVFTDDYYYRAYSKGERVFPDRDFPRYAADGPCKRYGLDCFSLFAALRTAERDRFTYVHDGHLNSSGADAVARALAERLADRLPMATEGPN